MFCDKCGAEMQAGSNYCPRCGRILAWPTARLAQTRLERHLHIVGVLWIAIGALWLIPCLVLMVVGHMIGYAIPVTDAIARHFGPAVLMLLGSLCLLIGAGGICVGWGLMQRQSWARITAIILSVLAIFHPPLGTALGIYTLWVLLADESGIEYRRMAHA
jgi:hypothetical protein